MKKSPDKQIFYSKGSSPQKVIMDQKSSEDHNYSDSENTKTVSYTSPKNNIVYSKVSSSGKEKYIGLKITNLNDLKKATPKLKLPALLSSKDDDNTSPVSKLPEELKQKLHKYCRTCAGQKVPLVNIFSEKGTQMRLSQQIQHLEDINEHDSLSTQMCMDCICDMKMSYKFFLQIKKAEIKLKSIYNSFNDALSKSRSNNDDLSKIKSNCKPTNSESVIEEINYSLDETHESMDHSNSEINDIKSSLEPSSPIKGSFVKEIDMIHSVDETHESMDYSNSEVNDTYNEDNESFEEFDPEYHVENENASENVNQNENNLKIIESSTISEVTSTTYQAYRYDETINAYIKVEPEENQVNDEQQAEEIINNTDEIVNNTEEIVNNTEVNDSMETVITETSSQLQKTPNILKKKVLNENFSTESKVVSNKKDLQKFNIDLKDIKIPKLNLDDAANIRTEEDGVMYVTAKGSNPNELLLIKVKKVDKPLEKKSDKTNLKKKGTSLQKFNSNLFKKYDLNNKGTKIDEQIEQYRKKRVEILGDVAVQSEVAEEENELNDIRGMMEPEEIRNNEVDADEGNNTLDTQINDSSPSETVKKPRNEIKKKKTYKDSVEDCTQRLKMILKQKDEYIKDFISYLKHRRIVPSRLRDEDIITLYEAKNNVVLEKFSEELEIKEEILEETEQEEEIELVDPFEPREIFPCDFCDKVFPTRDMEFEHSKVHDYKLTHYCSDCQQEFMTHKAKRNHNNTCVQKLICKYCNSILESKGKKRQHEQKHCDNRDGQLCDLCGEKFKHLGTLDQHVKGKHMHLEKIYKCPQCPKKFAFRTKLTFHLKTVHTTTRPFLCEDCGYNFKNPASLRHHKIRKHQPTNNTKECPVCQKTVPVYSMSKHMHTHKAYTIECPHQNCEKMFKNSSTLKQHLRIHEDMRQYKCDICSVGFNRRDGLRLHLKVHQKADSRGLKECSCQVCGEKFPNHSTLVIHRNRKHKDGKTYTCHICNRSMISQRSLEWHLANIHNETLPGSKEESSVDVESKRVACYHCEKTFKTEMILRTHIKNTHTEKEPMKCLDCSQLFMSEVRLKHHMMIEHERLEGTLECPHCTKRFVNQLRLKTHMISHSDERPHTCDLCGFMLKTKIQLIKHKQNRHSNERPLQCKYCSWRCKQVSALVCHERTHTNERPYSCSVCKQKFKYLGDKNKHERRHESLGGSGFKRIVTGRSSNLKNLKKKEKKESDIDQNEESFEMDVDEEENDSMEKVEEDLFEEQVVKLEDGQLVTGVAETCYEPMYVEEESQDDHEMTNVVIGVEDTAVYTEEVTADNIGPEIITSEIITEAVLQPGTVVHLEQQDENGKIQMIPVMLSLPDLSDATSEVNLATASIMYSN